MKRLILFLLALAMLVSVTTVFAGCEASKPKTQLSNSENGDNVEDDNEPTDKPVTNGDLIAIWVIESIVGFKDDTEIYNRSYQYDQRGNMLEELYKVKGEEFDRSVYQYDKYNNPIDQRFFRGGTEFSHATLEYTYDDTGKILEITANVDDVPNASSRQVYTYDDAGRLIEIKNFQGETESQRYTCSYDPSGNKLEENNYQGDKITGYKKYDAGKLIEELDCHDDNFENRYVYAYDNAGGMTETCYQNGSISSYCSYDKEGNVLERILYPDEVKLHELFSYEYSYDDNGNMTQYIKYENDIEIERYTYTYDGNGRMVVEFYCTFGATNYGKAIYRSYQVTKEQKDRLDELEVTSIIGIKAH